MTNDNDRPQNDGLPNGWAWAMLEDVASQEKNAIVDGPFGSNMKVSDYIEDGVPVLTTKNLSHGYEKEYLRFVSHEKFEQLKRSEVKPGDILVAKIGSCGKTGIYPSSMPSALIPANLLKMTVRSDVVRLYVYYFLNSPTFKDELDEIITATAQPAFNVSKFRKLPIPVAPLPEQHRIVAKIEEQFTRLDAGVAALKRAQANLKRYKASVLKAACEGKLVEQNPSDEPASELLKRILAERQTSKARGRGDSRIAPTDDLPELPQGWCWATLESISAALGGYAFSSRDYTEDGFQIVKIGNVKMGRLELDTHPSYIDQVPAEIQEKYLLKNNDIVITLTGTRRKRDYGFAAIVKSQKNLLLNQRVARLRFSSLLDADYFLIALQSEDFRNYFFKYETGNVGQGNVGMQAIMLGPVAVPPLAEQRRIVAEVERRLSVVQELEGTLAVNLARAERLRQSILKRAFEGKLV